MLISVIVAPVNAPAISLGLTAGVIAALLIPLAFYFSKKYVHGKGKRRTDVEDIKKQANNDHNKNSSKQNAAFGYDNELIYTSLDHNDRLHNCLYVEKEVRTSIKATRVDPNINTLNFYDNNDTYFISSSLPSGFNEMPELVKDLRSNPSIVTTEKFSQGIDLNNRNKKNCVLPTLHQDEDVRFPQEDFTSSIIKNSKSSRINNRIQNSASTDRLLSHPMLLPNTIDANENDYDC